jgi:hypothetical protein
MELLPEIRVRNGVARTGDEIHFIGNGKLEHVGMFPIHNIYRWGVITAILRESPNDRGPMIAIDRVFPTFDRQILMDVMPNDLVALPHVTIAGGATVGLNDQVWIWRDSRNYATLVTKVVECINAPMQTIKCSYTDRQYALEEQPANVYPSRDAAIIARPDLAARLRHCLLRNGAVQTRI